MNSEMALRVDAMDLLLQEFDVLDVERFVSAVKSDNFDIAKSIEARDWLIQEYGELEADRLIRILKESNPDPIPLRTKVTDWLTLQLGKAETERYLQDMRDDKFDYTEWRRENLWPGKTIEEIHDMGVAHQQKLRTEEAKAPAEPTAQPAPKKKTVYATRCTAASKTPYIPQNKTKGNTQWKSATSSAKISTKSHRSLG